MFQKMKNSMIVIVLVMLALVMLALAGCIAPQTPEAALPDAVQEQPTQAKEATPTAREEETEAPPAATATIEPAAQEAPGGSAADAALAFYQAYVQAVSTHKPALGSAAFDAQKYLSDDYLAQVAEINVAYSGPGFDPVLQAQMVPPEPVEIKEASEAGDQATVTVQFGRGVMEQPYERVVSLARLDGEWKIVPDRVEAGAASPEDAVNGFYDWYLGYIQDGSEPRSPLADQAYQTAPFLSLRLIRAVDALAEAEGGFGYDPFLCAQDVPAEMKILSTFYNEAHPLVLVGSSFKNHFLTLELYRENFNLWKIGSITCGGSPAGTALAAFTWDLGYLTGSAEMRNPWTDGAFRESPFLAAEFVQKVEEMLSTGDGLAADPLLLAQNLPGSVWVDPCPDGECALAYLRFGDVVVRRLLVDTVEVDGARRVKAVSHPDGLESASPANPPEGVERWSPLVDEAYGYTLRFPADWRVEGLLVTDHHSPEEDPLMRFVRFLSPSLDASIVPIRLDVMIRDAEMVQGTYGYGEKLEEGEVNGVAYSAYRADPGIVSYIFKHPGRENTWLVFIDSVSAFEGREEEAKAVKGVMEAVISTLVFER